MYVFEYMSKCMGMCYLCLRVFYANLYINYNLCIGNPLCFNTFVITKSKQYENAIMLVTKTK